jgi:predicted TPR repeat methyltransferase
MRRLQPLEELEEFYQKRDPWNYQDTADDATRKAMLLSVLPERSFERVLDIGCGDGFVTECLPGDQIIGVDVSANAIMHAKEKGMPHIEFLQHSLFDLPALGWGQGFDLIVITGVLYPQYIGDSEMLVYTIVDDLLKPGGCLVSCHIEDWYRARFPYITTHREYYAYREYFHLLEVYTKK